MEIKYELVHESTGTTIHTGTKEECEMILAAFVRFGEREDKFYIEME